MGEFYEKFEKDLKHAETHMTDIKRMEKPTDLICEKCGKPMVIKWGKHGSFIACTGYPECTNTRELPVDLPDVDKADLTEQDAEEYCENCGRAHGAQEGPLRHVLRLLRLPGLQDHQAHRRAEQKPDVPLDEKCPQCGSNLVMKSGRFGEFTACSNYPTCKYVKQKTIGVKCPDCPEGEIVRAALQARQDLLRLQPLPGVRLRGLGQADRREVPRVRRPLPGREVAQGRPDRAVPQRRVQVQARAGDGDVACGAVRHGAPWDMSPDLSTASKR